MSDPFVRLASLVIRRRFIVVPLWMILSLPIGAGLLGSRASTVVKSGGFVARDAESSKAATILAKDFNASPATNAVVVFHSRSRTIDALKGEIVAATKRLRSVDGVVSVVSFFDTRDPFLISRDRHTTRVNVYLRGDANQVPKLVPTLRKQLDGLTFEHYVTGSPAVGEDSLSISQEDLHRAEKVGIPIVLILLILVFRTVVSAAIPLVLGVTTVASTLGQTYLIASHFDTSLFALNVGSMVGLGLGIDFSLIVVSRYRAEVALGRERFEAIEVTMATAGRSIAYSGITVILSMLIVTLLMSDLMVIRSISLVVALVAGTALVGGLFFLPALLAILGDRIELARVIPQRRARKSPVESFWYRLSHAIMKRAWLWLIVSLGLLIVIALPVRDIRLLGASTGSLPAATESVKGSAVMGTAFGAPTLTPIQIVIQTGANGVWNSQFLTALQRLTNAAEKDSRVQRVQSLSTVAGQAGISTSRFPSVTRSFYVSNSHLARLAAQFINVHGSNSEAVVTVVSKYTQYDSQHENLVRDLRNTIVPSISQLSTYRVLVGGDAPTFLDFQDAVYGRFPFAIVLVMVLVFIILMMFFQSIFLPIKAIFMNLATVLATYGVLVAIFQYGYGTRLLGFKAQGMLTVITPVLVYVILFALSTDYEVFVLSRVREYYQQTFNNEESVAAGLQSTAGIITAAGLILVGTFGSFGTASVLTVKEIGMGLAIGVLLDTTVVRVIMVPATMRLMGNLNWYMPHWLKRVVPEITEGPALAPVPMASPLQVMPAAPSSTRQTSQIAAAAPAGVGSSGQNIVGRLVPIGGSVGTIVITLPRVRPLRIGRSPLAELQLFDPSVTNFHARIDYRNGSYLLTDLDSKNGVFLNYEVIPPREGVVLRDGDAIQISGMAKLNFRFKLAAIEPAGAMSG